MRRLPVGSVMPDGWLAKQISLTNDLQKKLGSAPDLLDMGAWTNGEILPRYVRGLILLAGVLGDSQLKSKVEGYVGAIFDSANAGGDFGPAGSKYLSPKIEAVKTVASYYELTGDERAVDFLRKFFKSQFNTMNVRPMWFHSRARLLEEIPAIDTVYKARDLEWLKDLAEMLRDNTCDWFKVASKFPYKKSAERLISASALKKVYKTVEQLENNVSERRPFTAERATSEWKKPAHQFVAETDGVSMAKAVKYPCTYGAFMGDDDLKRLSTRLIAALDKYHGNATGMFASDCMLAGHSPARGIDVVSAVEMTESLVTVLEHTGEAACADMLEEIVFNVIAAASSDDLSAVQDIVMPNQLEASLRRKSFFKEYPYGNAYVSGRLSRGAVALISAYPLFMQSLCMLRGADELNFFTYGPCVIDTVLNGARLRIREETGYPFRNTVVFKVEEAEGDISVRINFRVPRHTTMQLISGGQAVATGDSGISVKCILRTGSTFMLKMDIPLCALYNRDGSFRFVKGSVLMASQPGCEVRQSADMPGIAEANTVKKWAYTPIVSKKGSGGVHRLYDSEKTVVNTFGERPFDREKPPFELRIRCKNVLNWEYDYNGFSAIPSSPSFSEESLERVFVPFGCTSARISHFPPCYKS